MITQRIAAGSAANAADMAGKAMFTVESSETTRAPSAARSTGTARVYSSGRRARDGRAPTLARGGGRAPDRSLLDDDRAKQLSGRGRARRSRRGDGGVRVAVGRR